MGFARVKTIGRLGIRCFPIDIEIDVHQGMPSFTIVGLPDTVVQESKERIRAAIKNSGGDFPLSRITVNLAPADIKKEGVGFDLPIAIGILKASEQLPMGDGDDFFYGELGLHGELGATRGVLSFLLASKDSGHALFVPAANQFEASLVTTATPTYAVDSLDHLMLHLKGETSLPFIESDQMADTPISYPYDFGDIHGQPGAKRMLEIAAAGHHNVLLSGPPGGGKTLLSRALPSIMPPLSRDELVDVTQIYSIAGLLTPDSPMVTHRPFRAPHHSASMVALVGGGTPPRPGEITLAHHGVLFLDEFAEFPRSVIEALRQPLEDRIITVARAGASVEFPAHALFVAAVNPCPCGYKDDPKHTCQCTPQQIVMYQKKLSGPILDRIDLHLFVPGVPVKDLMTTEKAESSDTIRNRVIKARSRQYERYANVSLTTNSQLQGKDIERYCELMPQAKDLIERAIDKFNLSARSYHKVIKVARTIADLAGDDLISSQAVAEALQYRPAASE